MDFDRVIRFSADAFRVSRSSWDILLSRSWISRMRVERSDDIAIEGVSVGPPISCHNSQPNASAMAWRVSGCPSESPRSIFLMVFTCTPIRSAKASWFNPRDFRLFVIFTARGVFSALLMFPNTYSLAPFFCTYSTVILFFLIAKGQKYCTIVCMTTVNRVLIDRWVDMNGPDGLTKLAAKAGVSSSLLQKVRIGLVPKKGFTRLRICNALNVTEADLFPSVGADEKKAS